MIESLTRDQAKAIKHYSRKELELYLVNLQNESFNAGVDSALEKVMDCVLKGVKNAEGIGEKRYKAVITSITQEMLKFKQNLPEETKDEHPSQ